MLTLPSFIIVKAIQGNSILFTILLVSLVAQVIATWIALNQIVNVISRYRWAWSFMALALALMVERRFGPLWRLVCCGDVSNLADSVFGMLISLLMVVGFYGVRSLFDNLKALARTDTLTGLSNRYDVFQHALHEIERAARIKRPLAFLMFDIDYFKQVNDTYGHPAGDMVLRTVADIARREFRRIDSVGRIGGEEFLVVLPESDQENATAAAERFRGAIAAHKFSVGDTHIGITISTGVVIPDITTNPVTV
jgi:diguanylate cyclase (GGDEF)-like protein